MSRTFPQTPEKRREFYEERDLKLASQKRNVVNGVDRFVSPNESGYAGSYGISTVKRTPIISSDKGNQIITKNIEEHKIDTTSPEDVSRDTEEKAPETKPVKENKAIQDIGGITSDEANATGIDLNDYSLDSESGYFVPNNKKLGTSSIDKQFKEQQQEIDDTFAPFLAQADYATQNLINAYKNTFAQRISEEKRIGEEASRGLNTTLMRTGISRYAPLQAGQLMEDVERRSLARIAKIGIEEAQLIAEAEMNLVDKQYDVFLKKRGELKDIRKERQEQINKLQDISLKNLEAKRKQAQDLKTDFDKQLNDIMIDARKNGADDTIIDSISNAKTISDAVKSAGEYLQAGTGIIGEYNLYKREAVSKGQIPLSFDEYQTRDANRKISLAKASVPGGLSAQQNTVINSVNSSFESSPIVKNFIEIQNRYQNMLSNVGHGDGATDIAFIFDLMKTLDPTSVVRETEYETGAKKSGNIFAGKLAYLNGLIDPKGGFVSESAKENITGVIQRRFESQKAQYNNFRDEKIKRLENQNIPDGDSFITEYDYDLGTGKSIVDEQVNDEAKLTEYLSANNDKVDKAVTLADTIDPQTGEKFTAKQIYEFLNQAQ